MVRKKYTEEQIIAVLREGEAGVLSGLSSKLCEKGGVNGQWPQPQFFQGDDP